MTERLDHVAALGLGGNIGNPAAAMAQALDYIDEEKACRVEAVSRLYRTPPWGKTDQADFFNCCALVSTSLEPEPLLELCLDIEKRMKRVRNERWGPRTIDIDVLTYDDLTMHTPRIELPHPRMTQRGFVLLPLADIAPDMIVGKQAVAEWLVLADTAGIVLTDANPDWWKHISGQGPA